jgi:hypothetical protein
VSGVHARHRSRDTSSKANAPEKIGRVRDPCFDFRIVSQMPASLSDATFAASRTRLDGSDCADET